MKTNKTQNTIYLKNFADAVLSNDFEKLEKYRKFISKDNRLPKYCEVLY